MYKVVYNARYGGFSLSKEASQYLNDKYSMGISIELGFLPDNIERHDKRLIECVELLGEKANGFYANLKIAEISTTTYRIDEHDGFESVETPDSYDWVVIS